MLLRKQESRPRAIPFATLGSCFRRSTGALLDHSEVGGDLPPVTVGGEELIPAMTVARGWNLYNRNFPLSGTNPSPAGKVTGYDLSR